MIVTRNKAFKRAYEKGYIARSIGTDKNKNPYPDKLNSKGGPTWSRVFRNLWNQGWDNSELKGFKTLKK